MSDLNKTVCSAENVTTFCLLCCHVVPYQCVDVITVV